MRMVDNDLNRVSWRHLYPDEVVWKIDGEPYNVLYGQGHDSWLLSYLPKSFMVELIFF